MPKEKYKDASQRAKSKRPFTETERVFKEYFDKGPSESQLEKNATLRRLQQNTIDEYRKDTEKLKTRNRDLLGPSVKPPKKKR